MIREVIKISHGTPCHEALQDPSLDASLLDYEGQGVGLRGGVLKVASGGGSIEGVGAGAVGGAGAEAVRGAEAVGGAEGGSGVVDGVRAVILTSKTPFSTARTSSQTTDFPSTPTLILTSKTPVSKMGVGNSVVWGKSVGGVESGVGLAVDQPTREEGTWHGKPTFASTDIRYKGNAKSINQEQRSAAVIVDELNMFSRQGPGGLYELHGFSSVKHCNLCQEGCTCLFKCSGPPPLPSKARVSYTPKIDPPTSIPGLNKGGAASTSLTTVEETCHTWSTARYCHKLRDLFTPRKNFQNVQQGHSNPESLTVRISKVKQAKKSNCNPTIYVDLREEWLSNKSTKKFIFSRSAENNSKVKTTILSKGREQSAPVTSLFRKLSIAEDMCDKKAKAVSGKCNRIQKKAAAMVPKEIANKTVAGVSDSVATSTAVSGGGRGGLRANAGRKTSGRKNYDWKAYKAPGKKEKEKLRQNNKSIKEMFSKQNLGNKTEEAYENKEEMETEEQEEVFKADPGLAHNLENMNCEANINPLPKKKVCEAVFQSRQIPYFHNGCFALPEEKVSETNFTCAIDSVLSVCEALLLSNKDREEKFGDPVLSEAQRILNWRLANNLQWTHSLRQGFWDILSSKFPAAIQPLGRVDAMAEFPMFHLNKLSPLKIKVHLSCSECLAELGTYYYDFDEPCLVSHPLNSVLNNYTLAELLGDRINKRISRVSKLKVKCSSCQGHPKHFIQQGGFKFGNFFIINFGIVTPETGGELSLNCRDSCILKENLELDGNCLTLNSVLFASRQHFYTICKIQGFYYKFDNMIQAKTSHGYSSLFEAYTGRTCSNQKQFILNKSTVSYRNGLPFFAVYVIQSRTHKNFEDEIAANLSLNDLPVLLRNETTDDGDNFKKDINCNIVSPPSDGRTSENVSEETEEDVSSIHGDTVDPQDLEDIEEDSTDDVKSVEDIEEDMDTTDEDEETVTENVKIDYRLQDLQDLGRYQKNNPGSYFNHFENAWYCSICQNFSKSGTSKRPWVEIGVKLKRSPGRKFRKHFESKFHKDNCEMKLNFERARQGGKHSNIINLLKSMSNTPEDEVSANRDVVKIMFKIVLYQVKNMVANIKYSSLLKLVADCGAEALKKFIIKRGKNATYMSVKTFDKMVHVLNEFIEKPLLVSLRKSRNFCVYHDETTDIQNHSEAAIYVAFLHQNEYKEHFFGIINMAPLMSLTAEAFYMSTLQLFDQKKVDLKHAACSDLDGCPTNQGVYAGFKNYFEYHNPFHLHQSCSSHALALIPKHKITESRFKVVASADKIMVTLYKHCSNGSLRTAIFENCQLMFENKALKLVCPSSTRWLSHEKCFVRILEVYPATLMTLANLYEERDEPEALGILMQIVDPQFILTAMMLSDMLGIKIRIINNHF